MVAIKTDVLIFYVANKHLHFYFYIALWQGKAQGGFAIFGATKRRAFSNECAM